MSAPIISYLWTWFSDVLDLPSEFIVTRPGSVSLSAEFIVAQGSADVKAKAIVRNIANVGLLSKFWIYQWWLAKSLTINTGAVISGQLRDTYSDDDDRLELREGAATPGFDYDFTFENIPASVSGVIRFKGYYEGNPAHVIRVKAWNWATSTWQYLTSAADDIPSDVSDQNYTWDVSSPELYSGGVLKLKIVHESAGTSTNKLWINYLWLDDSIMAEHLHAFFIVEHDAYAELRSKLLVTHSADANLLGHLSVRHSGSVNLQASFRPGQDTVELQSGLRVRNKSSVELHAEVIVRQSTSSSLHSIFRVLHWQELVAEFVIRRTAINPPALKAKFVVVRTYAELLEHLNIRQSTSLDLQTHFIPRRSSSEVIQAEFTARHSGAQNLSSELVVMRSASANLQCGLRVQHYADLQAHFNVIRIYTPVPIYGGNLVDWINYIQGIGSGFIMTPTISNDPTQKVGGLTSLKLNSIFSTGRYDGIRFGYHAYPSIPIPSYNFLNLKATLFVQQPHADLKNIFNIGIEDSGPLLVGYSVSAYEGISRYPPQSYLLYERGRFFAFWKGSLNGASPGTKISYRSTNLHDYSTFGPVQTLSTLDSIIQSSQFSVCSDDLYVHLAYVSGTGLGTGTLYYVRGELINDGTINWGTKVSVAINIWFEPVTITTDSSGHVWISTLTEVYRNNNLDGTWSNYPGSPYSFAANHYPQCLLAFPNGDMYVTLDYYPPGGGHELRGAVFTGGAWGAPELITDLVEWYDWAGARHQRTVFNIVVEGYDLHLAFLNYLDHAIYHKVKTGGAWLADVYVDDAGSGDATLSLSKLGAGKLLLIWNEDSADHYLHPVLFDGYSWAPYTDNLIWPYYIEKNSMHANMQKGDSSIGVLFMAVDFYSEIRFVALEGLP